MTGYTRHVLMPSTPLHIYTVLLHTFGYLGPRDGPPVTSVAKLMFNLYKQSRPGYVRPASLSMSLTNSPIVNLAEEAAESGANKGGAGSKA